MTDGDVRKSISGSLQKSLEERAIQIIDNALLDCNRDVERVFLMQKITAHALFKESVFKK